ncbi:MAG: haloacid dehalogenase [Anaerolineae bacterium]|jgi:translin|nr:haloacid dehalogenase [Anaerolineae bacterium]
MEALYQITQGIREVLGEKDAARDLAVRRSRELIRHCSECIRAVHRREWDEVDRKLAVIQSAGEEMRAGVAGHPDLYHTGYTQDAFKELVEAHITAAIIRDQTLPTPALLGVPSSTYLLGMAEAATELRRFILDLMRLDVSHSAEAERLLTWMDAIYEELVTFDFPDAITYGLRRQTDVVRGVLERTRGDLTTSLRQQRLQDALQRLESRL